MEPMQNILIFAIPIYSLVTVLLGVWLGHKITMKAFSHVQPSTKEMTKMANHGSVTQEKDWFDEATDEQPPEVTPEEDAALREKFKETGLPMELFESYQKTGRHPSDFFGYDTMYNTGVEEEIDKSYDISDLKPKEAA